MENSGQQNDWYKTPSRKTLRLTFRFKDGSISLISHERLDIICPPIVGEKPEKGKHGGFWIELMDEKEQVMFHRVLPSAMLNSVEVHSPDGKIRREFGQADDVIFEVLVPDDDNASHISLIGQQHDENIKQQKMAAGPTELARFEIPKNKGGKS